MKAISPVTEHLHGFKNRLSSHYLVRNLRGGIRLYLKDRLTLICVIILTGIIFLAVFGPWLAPYEADAINRGDDGEILRTEGPSSDHWLGTTSAGEDVLSQIIIGTRPTALMGFSGGLIIVTIGLFMGVTSGYFGGRTDSLLMRLTDFAYGIPIVPTAIVIVAFFGVGFWSTVALIGLLLWRSNARVFRSQVLQIKEREHVETAEMLGASSSYIILRHILPNMMGMVFLFFALGTGVTILLGASLAFLGFLDPFVPSWGVIIRNAYGSGYMRRAWWWIVPPGLMISLTVVTIILLGRGYERVHEATIGESGR